MVYYNLTAIKKNLELLPSDTSLDSTLDQYGQEADSWVDAVMGNGTALTTVPTIITHISSNYAAGRYLNRVKEDARGKALIETAYQQLRDYIRGPGNVVVFG